MIQPPQKHISQQLNYLARHTDIRWEHIAHSMACFRLKVNICCQQVSWQVEYQFIGGEWVPDFIFPDDFNPLLPLPDQASLVPHLLEWKMQDRTGLHGIVKSILKRCRQYQKELIEAAAPHNGPLNEALEDILRNSEDAELLWVPGNPSKAILLVRLSGMDFSQLNSYFTRFWDRPEDAVKKLESSVRLRIVYPLSSFADPTANLHMPYELESLLGEVDLPDWEDDISVHEYLDAVKGVVHQSSRSAGEAAGARRQLMLALAATSFGEPLEIDMAGSRSAVFQINYDGLNWALQIDISRSFPAHQPSLRLQNAEDLTFDKRYIEYPWSPRWSPQEMASRIKSFIEDTIDST